MEWFSPQINVLRPDEIGSTFHWEKIQLGGHKFCLVKMNRACLIECRLAFLLKKIL
jgi:hypothetical protein